MTPVHSALIGSLPPWVAAVVWLVLACAAVLLWRACRAEETRRGDRLAELADRVTEHDAQLAELTEVISELVNQDADLAARLADLERRTRRDQGGGTEF